MDQLYKACMTDTQLGLQIDSLYHPFLTARLLTINFLFTHKTLLLPFARYNLELHWHGVVCWNYYTTPLALSKVWFCENLGPQNIYCNRNVFAIKYQNIDKTSEITGHTIIFRRFITVERSTEFISGLLHSGSISYIWALSVSIAMFSMKMPVSFSSTVQRLKEDDISTRCFCAWTIYLLIVSFSPIIFNV